MLVRVGCWLLVRVLVVGWLGLVVGSCWLLVRVLVVGWLGLVVGSCWLLVYLVGGWLTHVKEFSTQKLPSSLPVLVQNSRPRLSKMTR